MSSPIVKAWLATGAFSIAGCTSLFFFSIISSYLIPHSIFYIVLVLNTFFSIRFFSRIAPENNSQIAIDIALVLLYLALAFSLNRPVLFAFFALCLFIAATTKYSLLLLVVPQTDVLKRKIIIDLMGTAACAATLGLTLLGHAFSGAWALAIIFTIANIYLLFIQPMYRL